jgi:Tfp pilus assembly protein PilN
MAGTARLTAPALLLAVAVVVVLVLLVQQALYPRLLLETAEQEQPLAFLVAALLTLAAAVADVRKLQREPEEQEAPAVVATAE